ncbi:hypothetical protein AAAC51_20300 [Priestia megaterium]
MKRIKLIKEELEKYKASFSTEEYNQLNSAVTSVTSSLNKQVEMLEDYKKIESDLGINSVCSASLAQ